jgi:hypothetical protein
MNRRRQHPAAAAARRARFYRAGRIEEQTADMDAGEQRASSHGPAGGEATSSRAAGLSGRVDGGRFADVEDAA